VGLIENTKTIRGYKQIISNRDKTIQSLEKQLEEVRALWLRLETMWVGDSHFAAWHELDKLLTVKEN